MLVRVTVRIDGREVGNLSQTISGDAVGIEEATRRLGQRIEGVIVECGFDELARKVPRPVCCGRSMESRGRRRLFDLISGYLIADRADISYSNIAQKLGVTETEVKRLLHRMRQRYRELLRDEVAQTVEQAGDVDEEIRYLCVVLAAMG